MIREYTASDLSSTSGVWLRSGQAEYSYLPDFQKLNKKTASDVFSRIIQDECNVWVYEIKDDVVGFMAMDGNYIDRLYVDPKKQKNGIGSAFFDYAKKLYPEGLVFKTHQQNKRACLFYEARGFKPASYGLSPPPESMPDVEYHWNPDAR